MKDRRKTMKKSEGFKLKNTLKKQKLQENGITLIALVVTIIILLILAGVTLNIALSDNGLFSKAKKAVEDYKEAQDKESSDIDTIQDIQDELLGKVVLNGKYSEKNKVNMPKLAHTGLTAVKFNETATVALEESTNIVQDITDEEIQEDEWYSYSAEGNSQWANARTEDGSLWVWIPRFAYNIKYENINDKSKGGTIDIVFLKGTTDDPAPQTSEGKDSKNITIKRATDEDIKDKKAEEIFTAESNTYIVHPAFTDESSSEYANGGWDAEIPGFWMAKFEAGYVEKPGEEGAKETKDSPIKYSVIYGWNGENFEDLTEYYYGSRTTDTLIKWPTFQANKPSMNYIGISDAYELCQAMNKSGNPYGLKSSSIDSHLTKNSEWGAVAYLSYSKYGTNRGKITINTTKVDENSIWSVTGYGTMNSADVTLKLLTDGTEGAWNTNQGKTASTTGNMSGIYDMSGGLWEWVAGYVATVDSEDDNTYDEKLMIGGSTKYKNRYDFSENELSEPDNYNVPDNQKKKGEAIWETSKSGEGSSGWNTNRSAFPIDGHYFFRRGGACNRPEEAGVFAFCSNENTCTINFGFRTVLI